MPFNNEIEELKAQIKVLEKKLSFLEELEQTKSPVEEGYKKVYGYYPAPVGEDCYWEYFKNGYEQAQKDYNVGEYQEPIPEEEPKTLLKEQALKMLDDVEMFTEGDFYTIRCALESLPD